MTTSFDAYDLMRRSFLSSIMGLKQKERGQLPLDRPSSGPISTSSLHRCIQPSEIERTPHDIYEEIVVECAQIESSGSHLESNRSSTELDSSSTSCNSLLANLLPFDELSYPICSSVMKQTQPPPYPVMTHHGHYQGPFMTITPPPYSVIPEVLAENSTPISIEKPLLPVVEQSVMLSVKPEDGKDVISLEELVKMVVLAMNNSALTEIEKDSPEEILRRKREQNNKAAARYRKRQREARDVAEGQLSHLMRRNESLRKTIERMQSEIAELKSAVLAGNKPNNPVVT